MFQGVWQLARLSLRQDGRRLSPHLSRLLLGVLLLLAILQARLDQKSSAPGLAIFQYQLVFSALFLTVNALFGFSQLVAEEKEHGTLDLLNLAGVNSLAVILGKTLPRLWDAVLLLAVQFPFSLLTMTLGGVSWPQILSAYVVLGAYLWLLGGISVWASARQPSGASAVCLASLVTMGYSFPWMITHLSGLWPGGRWLANEYSLHTQLWHTLTSGFSDSPWTKAVGCALTGGSLFFLMACFSLGRVGGGTIWSLSLTSRILSRSSERAWTRPIFWRDYRFTLGGKRGIIVRLFLHLAICGWMSLVHRNWGMAFVWTALIGGAFSTLDGTWSASRLFSDEIRELTWSTLVQTPQSVAAIARDKFFAWVMALSPSLFLPYLFILLTLISHDNVTSLVMQADLLIGSLACGAAILAYLHLLVLWSLDWSWKAIPLTFGLFCGSVFLYFLVLSPWKGWTTEARCLLSAVTCLVMGGICVWLQRRIVRHLVTLAETA